MTKSITVNTNCSGKDATITLRIKGELWKPVQVTPRSASFGRLTAEKAQASQLVRKLTIENNVEGVAKIEDVRSSNPVFTADVKTLEPGKKFELIVTVAKPLKPGSNSGTIEFATGIEEAPTVTVPVSAYVTAQVQVTPNRLLLPQKRLADMKRQLFIQNNGKNPVKISAVTVSTPAITAELTETRSGRAFQVALNIPVDYEAPPEGDQITIKTDNPTVPELIVPIRSRQSAFRPSTALRKTAGGKAPSKVRPVMPKGKPAAGKPNAQSKDSAETPKRQNAETSKG